jgi:hypothetical protein
MPARPPTSVADSKFPSLASRKGDSPIATGLCTIASSSSTHAAHSSVSHKICRQPPIRGRSRPPDTLSPPHRPITWVTFRNKDVTLECTVSMRFGILRPIGRYRHNLARRARDRYAIKALPSMLRNCAAYIISGRERSALSQPSTNSLHGLACHDAFRPFARANQYTIDDINSRRAKRSGANFARRKSLFYIHRNHARTTRTSDPPR